MKNSVFLSLFMFCFCAVSAAQTTATGDDILFVLSGGRQPEENILYKLDSVQVLQSIDGGVLITLLPAVSTQLQMNTDVAFLSTNEKFVDNTPLVHRWAYYAGQYKYRSKAGSTKNVYAFKMFNKEKGGDLNEGIGLSRNQEQVETEQISYVRTPNGQARAFDRSPQSEELPFRK